MREQRLFTFLRLVRAEQYVKNTFCFLPLFFSGKITDGTALLGAFQVFFAFCCASSVVYIVNDLRDREEDRRHPVKRFRPLAAGDVSAAAAAVTAGIMLLAACLGAYFFSGVHVLLTVLAYLALNLVYCFFTKHMSILDVTCVAVGFVLRVVGGSMVVSYTISPWLVLQTFLLCMVLSLGKRWDDIRLNKIDGEGTVIRASLGGYSEQFVLSAMNFFATTSCICYIIYTLTPATMEHYNSEYVYLTSGWVILGVIRYMQITLVEHKSGSPTRVCLRDRFIKTVMVLWAAHLSILLYWDKV